MCINLFISSIAGFPAAAYAAYAAGRGFSGYPSFGLPYPTGNLNLATLHHLTNNLNNNHHINHINHHHSIHPLLQSSCHPHLHHPFENLGLFTTAHHPMHL